jgi:GNAT superfamily N-acetyltransferase
MANIFAPDELIQQGYTLTTENHLIDTGSVHHYLAQESYWAQGISLNMVQTSINNSTCFGINYKNSLCAFARVISDKATFAYICDVFVLEPHRGKGLSKWLMQNIKQHNEFSGLRRWSLATYDAHELYSQYGFTPLSRPDRWMEIFTPHTTNHELQE